MGRFLGILCAVLLHVSFILFGGLIFGQAEAGKGRTQEVELLSDEVAPDKKPEPEKKEDPARDPSEEIAADDEPAPDADEILRNLELSAAAQAPALEAASLSAIEDALSGRGGGGGDFAQALDFASGGRIGGSGKAGVLDEKLESAFSLAEIDQKPRAIFQTSPVIPAAMRGKKLEAVVTVIFVVDAAGKVADPKVEKSTHVAFEKPALEAVRQWKFEPAVRGGQRVACRMRVGVRFPPS